MAKPHVLIELDHFLKIVTASDRDPKINLTANPLVRSSLHLLESLPAARDIIFDYFAMVYDLCIQSYTLNANIDPQTGLPATQSKSNANSIQPTMEDEGFMPVQAALENLVYKGPPAWRPVIAHWSLNLAGRLSDKHTKRKMSIVAACNYWLNSGAMRGLLTLISCCFRKLTNAEAESCVETLLGAFERYSLTFDWIVARLGGCFPLKIITQILNCSLKRFVEEPRCRFDSEIGVLDYLAFAHEQDLNIAFRDMLKEGFQPKKSLDASIIPFMLTICNYSDVLLQNLANVFLEMYNNDLISVIVQKSPLWMSNKAFADMQPSLNNIALRLNNNGTNLLIAASKLAEEYIWCQDFLECSLQELEQLILNVRPCPLLSELAAEESKKLLWQSCVSTNIFEQQTAVRLLLLVSTQHFHIYYQTISELLKKSYLENKSGIGALLRMIGGQSGVVEFPGLKPGVEMVLTDVLLQEQFQNSRYSMAKRNSESLNTFQNLVTITRLEKKNFLPLLKQQSLVTALNDCLPKILQILDVILTKLTLKMEKDADKCSSEMLRDIQNNKTNNTSDSKDFYQFPQLAQDITTIKNEKMDTDEIEDDEEDEEKMLWKDRITLSHLIIDLLNTIEAGSKTIVMGSIEILKLSTLAVTYFFLSLTEKNSRLRSTAVNRVLVLLQRQCSARKMARTACLRELVEGALFNYGYLFGQYEKPEEDELRIPDHERVIKQNQLLNVVPGANRTLVHSGLIGRGLKTENSAQNYVCKCDPEIQNLLLKALDACCEDADKQNVIEGYSHISLLLVETVSTDVMYNGLPFPDEEFTKVTIERDMNIRRSFNNSPILWAFLGLIATHRPALCFSSVLLRALCATCLHQWRAKNVNKFQATNPNEELLNCTKKLLQIMAMGQLLPPPLSHLHMIIEYFEPPEIALILKECVWNYMKDHVPSPALFHNDSNGLHWRNASYAKMPPQYIDVLRNLMQKKLPKLGHHYHQMFIMCEINSSNTTTVAPESEVKTTTNDGTQNAMIID